MKGPLFVYFMTIIGIGSSLFYPYVAVLVYVLFAVMSPNALWYYNLPPTFFNSGFGYSEMVAYPMIIGWVLHSCGNLRIGRAYFPMAILVCYLLWVIVTSFILEITPLGWETVIMLVRLLTAMIIVLTLCNSVFGLKCLVWTIIFGTGFVAYELNMSYFGGFNRLQMVGFAGMDNNFFAVAMVMGATVSFFTGLAEKNYVLKALAFLSAVLQAHTVLFSMSRGGMLALCVVGAVSFLLLPKTPGNITLFLVAVIIGLALAGPSVRERFFSSFENMEDLDGSAQSRLTSWKNCITVIKEKPVMGVGIQNWARYARSRFGIFLEAHSTWLQAAAETGIIGGLLQASFIFACMWKVLAVAFAKIPLPDPSLRYYGQMVIAAMCGYVAAAQFVSLYYLEVVYYVCLVGLCCLKISFLYSEELEEEAQVAQA
ncbi:MAG: O-antigen ligase family protein [Planctomycetia bacterium]|nr:O-antigen ligase family protein [Planctomycetia bacterium]